MQAYVQISLDSAKEKDVLQKLESMPQIKEVHILFGEWDMIAKVEVPGEDKLGPFIIDHIRTLPGVKLTSTMIIAK
ncbi:MAG TPA: Lrp/AsnC ligand binding domain-containing protein [Candidatus Nanoarchaeia archaeon]|nr:Lrp/AsnC ligand binding domain-containing protein [Candidatus Nanoarchaeia archaeon]